MNKIKTFHALRVKLGIIAVFLIAIPAIAISFTYSTTVKEIIQNKYTQTATQAVYETGEKIEFLLDDIEEFSTFITSNRSLLEMLNQKNNYSQDEFNQVLRTFITSRDDIETIDLTLDYNYYTIGAKKLGVLKKINARLEDSSGQAVWLPTELNQIEILSGTFNKYYFTLGRKIVDFNTLKDYGYLRIDIEEDILGNAYSSLLDDEFNNFVEVFICDTTGRIISHPNKEKIGMSIKDETYAKAVLGDTNGYNYVLYKTNIDKLAIYSSIENNGWKIIKTISTDYLYQELNKIQANFIVGGIIYGLVIIGFMIIFSVRYTEPMMKMMSVIKKVEQGDLTARTEVHSNDELGQLGNSLNNMIGEMQILIDRLIREEQEKKEIELEALHAQINPHFLYNTLNTIKWMAKIQGNVSVSKAITALTKLLRISTNLGRDMISLREEVDYVMNYVVIQRLRLNEAIHVVLNIDEDCLELTVPKLILQPIVENSIIYGLADERPELKIEIKGFIEDDQLIIEIRDDGPGIEDDVMKNILTGSNDKNKFSKVGLNNVNHRVRMYCGKDYGLSIESVVGEGTLVRTVLSINTTKTVE